MLRAILGLTLGVALAGCSATTPVRAIAAPPSITARGAVHTATTGNGYQLKALRQAYTYAALDHLEVFLLETTDNGVYNSDGQNAHELDLGSLPVSSSNDNASPVTVSLTNLKARKAYQVRLEAYQLDPARDATTPVRVDDGTAANITAFDTNDDAVVQDGAQDDVTVSGGFGLALQNQTFSGTAAGGIAVQGEAGLTAGTDPISVTVTTE